MSSAHGFCLAAAWACLVVVLFAGRLVLAEPPLPAYTRTSSGDLFKANTSHAAQDEAIASIPLDKLDPSARVKVSNVIRDVSLFRRLPVEVVQCDPELYGFLLEHPDVVVNVWQSLGISRITMQETSPGTFAVSDDAGTTGTVQILYRDQHTQIVFADGAYNGPVFGKPLQGRVLIVLRSGQIQRSDGRSYITARIDAFTQIDNIGLELITKTIQPLVGKTADLNFAQTMTFVGTLSRTAEFNQAGIQRLARRLGQVKPEVRDQFAQISERVGQRAAASSSSTPLPAVVAKRPGDAQTR
jgi:hypothetical protein